MFGVKMIGFHRIPVRRIQSTVDGEKKSLSPLGFHEQLETKRSKIHRYLAEHRSPDASITQNGLCLGQLHRVPSVVLRHQYPSR